MPRKADPNRKLRGKMNLTIHPEIRAFADQLALKRRRSISQLFEDLIEAEWVRSQTPVPSMPAQPAVAQPIYPQPVYPQQGYYIPSQYPAPAPQAQ
jgi:hypothetical protein